LVPDSVVAQQVGPDPSGGHGIGIGMTQQQDAAATATTIVKNLRVRIGPLIHFEIHDGYGFLID
jgi:hypothetical protein